MRARLVSAAVVALVLTGAMPTSAKAQVVYHRSINSSPYQYSNVYNNPAIANYMSALTPPSAYYWSGYNFPGYQTYSYGWTNPYSTWGWSGYQNYPVYPTYSSWGYRGWRRW